MFNSYIIPKKVQNLHHIMYSFEKDVSTAYRKLKVTHSCQTRFFLFPLHIYRISRRPKSFYSLDRRRYLIGFKELFLRLVTNVCRPFRAIPGLMSQSSILFGMQTSKRIWLRTPWGLMLGRSKISPCCLLSDGPASFLSLDSIELGRKKWSLGPFATLFRLSFELAAAS